MTKDAVINKVRPDWGKEFQGQFESHCSRVGTEVERGLPRRSTTFSRAERWHRTLEEGVRADLVQSGMPVGFWSLSAVHWTGHWNRLSRDGRPSPYVKRYKRQSGLELRPFGSLIVYLKDKPTAITNLPKFEPRGDFGVVVGYGAYSSYLILRLQPYIQDGKRLFKRTRDVKFPVEGLVFPVRTLLKSKFPEVSWHFRCPCESQDSQEAPQVCNEEQPSCKFCLRFVVDSSVPILCPACLAGGTKRISKKSSEAITHSGDPSCRLARCSCVEEACSSVVVEESIDPQAPCEHEESSLAELCFSELLIGSELPSVDPNEVEAGFEEPDVFHANAARSALSSFPTAGEEAVRNFCMVYKSVSLKSESASCPAARAAVSKELKTMMDLLVWDGFETVMEMWELRALHADALVVYAHLLLGCKDIEGCDLQEGDAIQSILLKWKARLVAGGNRLLDNEGKHYREKGLYGAPTSLEAIRLVCWWATMCADHVLLQADVSGAYLQSRLGGRPVWVVLPPAFWPKDWHDRGLKQPVLRLRKALYGLQRSGFDWAKKANAVLSNLGWVLVPDVVDAVYTLREGSSMCIMALYVDDILAAGPGPMLVKSLNAIRGV